MADERISASRASVSSSTVTPSRIRPEFLHDFRERRRRDVGPHASGHDKEAGRTPEDELRVRAVGVAVRLAQVEVDAAGEEAAEDVVRHHHRLEVGRHARRSNRYRPQLRLRRTRLVHQHDPGARRGPEPPRPATSGVPRCQSPNAFSTSGRSSASGDAAGHHERGVVRHVVPASRTRAGRRQSPPSLTPRCRVRSTRTDAPCRRAPPP